MEQEDYQGFSPSPYQSPMHMYGSAIMTLTNPQNELYRMELTFRSMILDDDDKPRQVGDPLMNEEGIASVIGQVQAIVNQVTVMSNMDKNDVPNLILYFGDTLAQDLMMNREKYGIKNISARARISTVALLSAYITLKRAFEEGDKRFWKGSVQEIKSTVEQQNRNRSFLSRINPFSR